MTASLYSFDRVADRYDATRGFPADAETRIGAALAGLLPEGSHLLEVGIGSGRVAVPVARNGVRVTGIDLSRNMMALLHAKDPGIGRVLGDAGHQPFRDGAFDGALFVHILHLVPDVDATVRESLRVVRTGGLLLACSTTYAPGPVMEANDAIRQAATTAMGREPRLAQANHTPREVFARVVTEAGASLHEVEITSWPQHSTGRELLDEIGSQLNSWTWTIPAESLGRITEAATPAVERILGGLDSRRESEARFSVTVATLP